MSDAQISADLEAASQDNYESWLGIREIVGDDALDGYNGNAQHFCDWCGRPLVISAYGTWFAFGSLRHDVIMTYNCLHGEAD